MNIGKYLAGVLPLAFVGGCAFGATVYEGDKPVWAVRGSRGAHSEHNRETTHDGTRIYRDRIAAIEKDPTNTLKFVDEFHKYISERVAKEADVNKLLENQRKVDEVNRERENLRRALEEQKNLISELENKLKEYEGKAERLTALEKELEEAKKAINAYERVLKSLPEPQPEPKK